MSLANPTLHAIGNAHIDPVWLWRWTEGLETIRSTFRSALDRMNEYEGFIFTGSSAAFYAMLAEVDPAMVAEIAARVAQGRWEIVGGWWVQPDNNVPCGESFVRQALQGQLTFERLFGLRARVGYNPDTFGHAAGLPQILRQSGLDRYAFMRPEPHELAGAEPVFRWRSDDGSEVLTVRIPGPYCTWPGEIHEHVDRCNARRPASVGDYVAFYGVGNHGGGPTKANIESLLAMADAPGRPRIVLSSLDAFFNSVEADAAAGAPIQTVDGELQHHARGCYTVHAEVKRQNRRLEHLLMAAERVSAAAQLLGLRTIPTEALASAWQDVLFNQFHDILAGTSLPAAYDDARDHSGHAAGIAGRALDFSAQAISGSIDTRGDGDPVVAINTLPWAIRTPVEVERLSDRLVDAEGARVAAQAIQATTTAGQRRAVFIAEAPALGATLLRQPAEAVAGPDDGDLVAREGLIANDALEIRATQERGWISLVDRASGREQITGPAAAAVVIRDLSDTWSHDVVRYGDVVGRFATTQVVLEEEGPVRASLRIDSAFGVSSMTQWIRLYRGLPFVEIDIDLNWQEPLHILKLEFPFALTDATVTADAAYAVAERRANGEEEPCGHWVALCSGGAPAGGPEGWALINDGKHGYDADGSLLRMSLVRSPAYAHHNPDKLRPERHYRYMDLGEHRMRFRLLPIGAEASFADVTRAAWEMAEPPVVINEYQHDGSRAALRGLVECSSKSITVTVVKGAEDGRGTVLRAADCAGTGGTARLRLGGTEWEADFSPWQIRSWRIVDGVASPCTLIEDDRAAEPEATAAV